MPRTIPTSVQNLLASGEAIDPIMVVGITFGSNGVETLYADRDLGDPLNPGIRGQILEFGQLEDVTRIDGNGTSSSISFKLADADGSIKGVMDAVDLTFHRVTVYQYFDGLSINDLVLMFEGVLASPITWDEGTRSVQFTAITRQSNYQVGFSLDESNVPVYHQSLLNKPWPMVFGSPIYSNTLLLQEVPVGYILNAFVLPDPSIPAQLVSLQQQMNKIASEYSGIEPDQSGVFDSFGNTYSTFEDLQEFLPKYYEWASRQQDRIDAIKLQMKDLQSQQAQQYAKWLPHNQIVGGYRFPQGVPLICKINERTFKITFHGGTTIPTNPEQACPATLEIYESPYQFTPLSQQTPAQQAAAAVQAAKSELYAQQLGLNNTAAQLQALIDSTPFEIPRAGAEFFEEGSQVELLDNLPGGYWHVASITPGTVQGVYAYRVQNGYRRLAKVPPKYYSVQTQTQGALTFTYVVLLRPLSTVSYFDNLVTTPYNIKILNLQESEGQLGVSKLTNKIEWEDEIFVNVIGSIGPNVVDIMIWLIQHYTLYTYDAASFNAVRTLVNAYPAAFCLESRPVVDELLSEIAYQSRCAIWIKNNIYYIKYLPATPTVTNTITDDDIDFGSLRVSSTSTDNIVTKFVATWKQDGVHETNEIVVKHNVEKYGIIEETHDFYIYNNYNLVLKSATFWAIRKSNVWKIVTANLHLGKLGIETLDDINLTLASPFVTTDVTVPCQVESCQYDSDQNLITVELWTGIKFGEMTPYPFAHPASLTYNTLFPLYTEQHTGAVPSIPAEVFTPLIPYYNQIQKTIFAVEQVDRNSDENGFLTGNRPSTQGDPFPSDVNDRHTQPAYYDPTYTTTTRPDNSYVYSKIPPALSISPDANILAKSFPGRVVAIGGDGETWQLDMWPNGLDDPAIRKYAKEVHADANLRGIEGEFVTVYRIIGQTGEKKYYFSTQHTAAFPVLMANKTTGDIYPFGSNASPVTNMNVNQIQISSSYQIPANTWGIAVRVWNGNTARYEVQIPVWLPRS